MALSDLVVRQAKAVGKDYTLRDTDGLCLAVSAKGSKAWHFRYSWMKSTQAHFAGHLSEVSLREARILRDEARALVAKDINPRIHRKQKRAAIKFGEEITFEAVYTKWFAHRGLSLKKGRQTTHSILPRVFAKDVLPFLKEALDLRNQTPRSVGSHRKIEQRGALSVAKVRTSSTSCSVGRW